MAHKRPAQSQALPAPKGELEAGLYVIATPIGNLGDITFRAVETLKAVDALACEDTRVTAKLLSHLSIEKPHPTFAFHVVSLDGVHKTGRCEFSLGRPCAHLRVTTRRSVHFVARRQTRVEPWIVHRQLLP